MATVLMVRHGQAAFGSDHYDRLSDRGRQQARWLGEHLAALGHAPVRAVAGTLARQRDTAVEILHAMGLSQSVRLQQDAGLNEYDDDSIYRAHTAGADQLEHQRRDFRDYWRTFRAAMQRWSDNDLVGVTESWGEFGARVRRAVDEVCAGSAREDILLVVSSGGAIGRLIADLLGAPAQAAIELNLQCRNTGLCELIAGRDTLRVMSFNGIAHLSQPERHHAITYA
jgi:broad specificity phosphatase PhoE